MNEYATHQRMLVRAALRTVGPILELGAGWYSTPILHEIAIAYERFLLTHDNDPAWLAKFKHLEHAHHHHVGLLDRRAWEGYWGLVFVDHGPTPDTPKTDKGLLNALDRAQAVLDLMGRADVFVLHDTEKEHRWEYDYDKVLHLFKYSWSDETLPVHTTVLSNTIDVRRSLWTGR